MNRDSQAQITLASLEQNPHDLGAVALLERHYGAKGQWEPLVELLYAQAEQASVVGARARLLLEAGRIAAHHLQDAELGAQLLRMAAEHAAQDEIAYEVRLFSLAIAQDWENLNQFFAQAVEQVASAAGQSRLYTRLGEVLRDMLGDADQASEMCRYAVTLDPANLGALLSAIALAIASERPGEAAELLIQAIEAAQRVEVKADLMVELGDLYREQLGDDDAARACYENVVAFDPTHEGASRGLTALGIDPSALEPEVELVEEVIEEVVEEIALEGDDEGYDEDEGEDEDDAFSLEVIEVATEAVESEAQLIEREAMEEEDDDEPLAVDEALALEMLPDQAIAVAPELPDGVAQELALEDGTSEALEVLAETSEAFNPEVVEAAQAAHLQEEPLIDADPEDELPPLLVESLPEEADVPEAPVLTWRERLQLLRGELEGAEADDARAALVARMARKLWAHHDEAREDDLLALWRAAFATGQGRALYEGHHFRYEGESLWRQIMQLAQQAEVEPALVADIALYHAHDLDVARGVSDANGLEAQLTLIGAMDAARDNWRVYQRDVEQALPAELDRDQRTVETFSRLAKMALALGDADKLFDALRRLDRLSDEPAIKGMLQVIYRDTEKWPAYVDLIKQEAAALPADAIEDRVDLWHEAIRVYVELMRNDMQAIGLYKELLEADPDNRPALDALIALYEKNNRTSEQIALLQRKAELTAGRKARVALLSEIARLYLEKFRNQAEAIKAYEAVLESAPDHEEAVGFLKESYDKRREYDKLIALHHAELRREADRATRLEGLKSIAVIAAEKLRKPEIAVTLWQEALEVDPRDLDALTALEALYEKTREYAPLADVLERKARRVEDDAERMKLLQKLGMLASDRLDDPERAIKAWAGALKLDANDLKARKALERLYVDQQRWDELEALFGAKEAWAELVRMLDSLANSNDLDEATRAQLLLREARVCQDKLGDLGRAEHALERVLQRVDPRHPVAAERLAALLLQTEQYVKLPPIYEILLSHKQDPQARREEQLKLARVHAQQLNDPDTALSWYGQIFCEDPARLDDAEEMEQVARQSGDWARVTSLYELALSEGQTPELTLALRMRLARVLYEEQGQDQLAQSQLEAVLSAQPDHDGALAAMEQIFTHQQRWDDLMGVFQRRLALVDSPAKQVHILHGMAMLAEEQSQNPGLAITKLLEAYALDEAHEPTLQALHRLYAQQARHEPLMDMIRKEIALVDARVAARGERDAQDEARLVALHMELALRQIAQGSASREAVESLGLVLTLEPLHDEAIAELEAFLPEDQDPDLRTLAACLIEASYAHQERWEDLIGALTIQAEDSKDVPHRVSLYKRISQIYVESLGHFEPGFEHDGRALRLAPDDKEVRDRLAQLAEALDAWPELIQLYEAVLPSTGAPTGALHQDYLFTLARMVATRLGDLARAVAYYERILATDPASHQALAELEEVHTQAEDWRALISVYERQRALAQDPAQAESLRFRIAAVQQELLQSPDEAIATYQTILEERADNRDALDALQSLLIAQAQWRGLTDALRHELSLAQDDATRHAVQLRLSEVHAWRLDEHDLAIDLANEVLAQSSGHDGALDALDRLMREAPAAPAARASLILAPIYEAQEAWSELVDALHVQVNAADDDAHALALLHRAGELAEQRVDDPARAFHAYARALRHAPEDERTLAQLYRLAEQSSSWDLLVEAFEQSAPHQEGLDVRRGLLRRAAGVYLERLGDVAPAADRLQEILAFAPEDRESIDDLEGLYTNLQDYEPLARLLRHKATILADLDAQKELLRRAGQIEEEILDNPDAAIETYQAVLALDPIDAHAVERLEQLYLGRERWAELVEVLQIKLDLAHDDATRQELLYLIGALYAQQLEQLQDAIDTYRRVLDIDSAAEGALERLDELYGLTAQWEDQLRVLERRVELAQQSDERHQLMYRVGQLLERELMETPRAINVYRQVLLEDPYQEATTVALETIIQGGEHALEAAQVLQPIYDQLEQWEKLIHVYRLRLATTQDEDERLQLIREIASTYEGCLEDRGAAFAAYAEALVFAPSNQDVQDTLWRLAGDLDAWDPLIDHLDLVMGQCDDPVAINQLQLMIARAYDEQLGDASAAIDRYVRVIEADPLDEVALAALDRLYQQQGSWEALAEILSARVDQAVEPSERLALRLRLGQVNLLLDRVDAALDAYRAVLDEEPDSMAAIEALEGMFMAGQAVEQTSAILEPFFLGRGEHQKVVELYMQRLEHLEDPSERFALLHQIARLFLQELQDDTSALQALGAALVEQPADEDTLAQMKEIAARQGAWEPLVGSIMQALEVQGLDPVDQLRLWLELAVIIDEQMQSPDSAEVAYANALTLDAGDVTALAALDRIFSSQERREELANILERRIAATSDDEELIALNARLAALYQETLGENEAAIERYNAVLRVDPAHMVSLSALSQLYMAEQRWEDLYSTLSAMSELVMDGDEQAHLLMQMANLSEDLLGRRDDALHLLGRVLDLQPDNRDVLDLLRRLYIAEERWQELVQVIERDITLAQEDEERLALYENLGVIYGERLDNEELSLEAWLQASAIEPDYLPALEALRDLYARRGDYMELSAVLARMLENPGVDEDRLRSLWVEQADIQGNMLMQPEEAILAWRSVLAIAPGDETALDNLEHLYLQEGHWEESIAVLELKIDRLDDEAARLETLRQIASICEAKLMDRGRAAAYYEQILELTGYDEDAYAALEEIYTQLGDEESLSLLVNLYIDRASQLADEPVERVTILRRAAGIFEQQLDSPPSALVVLSSALLPETIAQEELLAELMRLAQVTGAWNDLLARFDEVLPYVQDPQDAFTLHAAAGRILAHEVDRPDDAVYHLQRALHFVPDDVDVMDLLIQLYRDLFAWPELAQTLRARIEQTSDPVDRAELWRQAGEVYETQLAEADNAIMAYEHILAIDQADLLAIEALERLFETFERWQELVDLLSVKANVVFDPEDVVAIRLRVAAVYEDRLGEPERAIAAYNEVLAVDQAHLDALAALERLYADADRWHDVLDVAEQQLVAAPELNDQVLIQGKIALIHEEQFQDYDHAIDAYHKVLAIQPGNETAIQNLERLYFQLERWFDLVDVVETHVQVTTERDQQAALLNELGRVQRDHIRDPHAAIEAFVRALDLAPAQPEVWQELGELYEQTEAWDSAVEAYLRRVDLTHESPARIALFTHIGELYENRLLSDDGAEGAYLEALKLDPVHAPALEALEALYARREDWQSIIRVLRQAEGSSRDLNQQARFLSAMGSVYDRRLDDQVSAQRYYEQALELDPRVLEAAEPLIDVYIREQRFERALPLLRKVLATFQEPGARPSAEARHMRHLQMAQTCEQLGLFDEALDQYYHAYEIDPTSMEGLLGFARQLYRHEDLEQALKIYQSLQLQHMERMSSADACAMFYQCGMIKQRTGDRRRALEFFEKALEYDPAHKESGAALLENYEATGQWERYIELRRYQLQSEPDATVRYAHLSRIGDVYVNELKQDASAIVVYLEALDLDPKSLIVLRKLLDLYTRSRQWVEAIDILKQLIEVETDVRRQAKFAYTIGVVYRDELRDPGAAVQFFEQALDLDLASMLKAFEGIDRILTDLKDWKSLERAYRRMLHRVASEESDQMKALYLLLWQNLGEIYRTRLGKLDASIQAFQMASELSPADEKLHLILAQLYETSQNVEGLIVQHRKLIEHNPFRIESYRALFKAYLATKAFDKAWCMASALSFLQSANDTEEKFYREYLGANLKPARVTLNAELFGMLVHPDQDPITTNIMVQITRAFAPTYEKDLREQGINKKKDQLDPNDKLLFSKIFSYVASRLQPVGLIPVPELYLRRDQAVGVVNARTAPPALIVGADMLQGKDERELAYIMAKRLGMMLPQHYMANLGLPTEYLKAYFLTAMHITDPSLGLDRTVAQMPELVASFQAAERVHVGLMIQVQKYTATFLKSGRNPNLSQWLIGVDHTTTRLGLLMCGDLKKAASCIKNDPQAVSKLSVKDRIKEMVLFSISEEYFELRRQLGLAIGG